MRKLFLLFIVAWVSTLFVSTGCTDKKPEKVEDTTVVVDTDTVADTTHADTIAKIIEETPMPKAADQLFDDFFFNFIANKKLQRGRIAFPLPVIENGKTTYLQRNQWKTDHFFMRQQYYTLIFDNAAQMADAKSTKLDSVIVEKIHLGQGLVEQYLFDHQDGKWRMNSIHKISFKDHANASFLTFLNTFFASNGAGAVDEPLRYSGPDPNGEETSNINTTISADEWSTFLPEMPHDLIYNIRYGQKYSKSSQKILSFRGLSNGIETQLVFKQKHGKWRMVKINAF